MNSENKIKAERLVSLDFFRGFTMFLLVAPFFRVFYSPELEGTWLYQFGLQFIHHPWNGLRFFDLIQPYFMFIVGVAMPLSYANRIKRGETHKQIRKHIIIRCLLLLLLGWALYCILPGRIEFRFTNVLAQLSVTIMISFLIMRKPLATQIIISLGLLLVSQLLYLTFWVEGYNQPFEANHNFGFWLDTQYGGQNVKGQWVAFNAIPTTAHTIWGVVAGKLLMGNKSQYQKLGLLVGAGILCLIIGYSLNPVIPIIKRIATSSFVITSGGWTLLSLALSFWLIDILKWRRGVLFFTVVGMNPLFIYLFARIVGKDLAIQIVSPFTDAMFGWSGGFFTKFMTILFASLLLWYICYWMYKRKIFIKI